MARCPNCGRDTARTKDWSCQWCGYPLTSRHHKKIDKTYRELKGESLTQPAMKETAFEVPEVEDETVEVEPEAELEPEIAPEPIVEPEPAPELRQKQAAESKPPAKAKPEIKIEPVTKPEPEPEAEVVPEPVVEAEAEPEPAPAPAQAPALELMVEDLFSAYRTSGEVANAKFSNKILRITGVVDRIEVKDALNIHYITLTSAEANPLLQSVRCVFDRKYGPDLIRLAAGQTVTVQGKYDGSIINFSLRDCVLVR